jgi:5-formyltetrahydrofolate cyclo-ligase
VNDSAKSQLRAKLRVDRNVYYDQMLENQRSLAFSRWPKLLEHIFSPGIVIAGYVAIGSEADPAKLLEQAENAGCRLALPYVTSRASPMRFLDWATEQALFPGPFNLLQPGDDNLDIKADVMIVPLLGFDRTAARLGQGAGHYDRALSILPDCIKIGLAWSVQEVDHIPADPWDIPLDGILTEKEWITP